MLKKLPVIFTIFLIVSIDGMDLPPNVAIISVQNNDQCLKLQMQDNVDEAINNNDITHMNYGLYVCTRDDSRLSMTKKLLEKGANAHAILHPFRRTPLQRAQENGAVKTVQLLLEWGANPFLTTNADGSLLWSVCNDIQHCYKKGQEKHIFIKKKLKIAHLLLELGADPNEQDQRGRPLLFKFIHPHKCALPILELLLRFGADITLKDYFDRNIFMYANKHRYGLQSRGVEYIKGWQEGKAAVKKKKIR